MLANKEMNIDESSEMYDGIRGEPFYNILSKTLQKGKMVPEYIDLILDEEGMKTFNEAFTSASKNPHHNYECLEQLGDVMANAAIKWYMFRRFPMIRCPEGVETGARLLIKYGAKQSFYTIAERLGFWPFISATVEQRRRNMKQLLEDVFEAFLGAVAETIDKRTRNGVGYAIVYDIIETVFDDMEISLSESNLVDTKTLIKECMDAHRHLGEVTYICEKEVSALDKNMFTTIANVYQLRPEKKWAKFAYEKSCDELAREMSLAKTNLEDDSLELISMSRRHKVAQENALFEYRKHLIWLGEGKAAIKKDAEKRAAKQGLETLKRRGITKKPKTTFDNVAGQAKLNNSLKSKV